MQNRVAVEPCAHPAKPWSAGGERPEGESDGTPRQGSGQYQAEPFAIALDRTAPEWVDARAQWTALSARAAPMLTPEFLLLTARRLAIGRAVLFGARRGGALSAALPLVMHGRTLRALRSDHSPRFDVVGEASEVPAIWKAIQGAGGWDVLELRGVPADSALATVLVGAAREDGFRVHVRDGSRAPWFEVAGIEGRIHRRFRGDMRRLERQMGGVEFERVTRFDRQALTDVLRLEAAAWKGAARTAIACDRALTGFYTALARVFARKGLLTLAFLRAKGQRIAAQFALEDAQTFYLLKTGYDPQHAHFGPGQLLVRETAADAERRGLLRYDLLGQDSGWKMKWTDRVRPHVDVLVYAPSPLGRARHFAREVARPTAGQMRRGLRKVLDWRA